MRQYLPPKNSHVSIFAAVGTEQDIHKSGLDKPLKQLTVEKAVSYLGAQPCLVLEERRKGSDTQSQGPGVPVSPGS